MYYSGGGDPARPVLRTTARRNVSLQRDAMSCRPSVLHCFIPLGIILGCIAIYCTVFTAIYYVVL